MGQSLLQARIIGVLPPGFEAPLDPADILLPAQLRPVDATDRILRSYTLLARLRADVTPERAKQMLESREVVDFLGGQRKLAFGASGVTDFLTEDEIRRFCKDLHDWAAWWGVPFAFPRRVPLRSVLPPRAKRLMPRLSARVG